MQKVRAVGFFRFALLLIAFLIQASQAPAQTSNSYSPPPYRQLRYEEDYSYLRDPNRRIEKLDEVKYVALNRRGDWYLSLGGEIRLRYENFRNPSWGQEPQDENGYLLQRYMLHADLHLGEHVRIFSQLKSGLENGRKEGPRLVDEDKLDLHQAFLDVAALHDSKHSLTFRVGRQEMLFGSSRLVSVRDGPNVRQSFDGVRLTFSTSSWRTDAFLTKPVESNRGIFDDSSDHSVSFWGLYAVRSAPKPLRGKVDLYYFGLAKKQARFDQGAGREVRHSFGAILSSREQAWDYNFEFVYQWGTFGHDRILAWMFASDTGYTLRSARFRPRIGLRADIASGTRKDGGSTLRTFNPLFTKGNYFGEVGLITLANLADTHPEINLQLSEHVSLMADWDFFWRESINDGLYGPGVNLLRSAKGTRARYVGSQPSLQVEWRIGRHVTLTALYTHFFAGTFLRETQPGKSLDYLSTWMTYKF